MIRVGQGYDSHRFDNNRKLVLCGITIEGHAGLAGHSDADAPLHALTDAILGAAGAGDIGQLFPDTDPAHKNADSAKLLKKAIAIKPVCDYEVINCDITIITESPRIGPYKQAMKDKIADILSIDIDFVSIKAKSNESMGFIGRGEGLAAMAAVLLQKK